MLVTQSTPRITNYRTISGAVVTPAPEDRRARASLNKRDVPIRDTRSPWGWCGVYYPRTAGYSAARGLVSCGRIIKKIFRNEAGEYIVAVFAVVECAGRLKARLISAETIAKESFEGRMVKALPEVYTKEDTLFAYTPTCHDIVSPFIDFSFLVSQPTRAPSQN